MAMAYLFNSFHHTDARIRHTPGKPLTPRQLKSIADRLCGCRDCMCGVIRGPQTHTLELIGVGPDGSDLLVVKPIEH